MTQSLDFYYDEYSQTDLRQIDIPSNAKSVRIYGTSITVIPGWAFINLPECTSLSVTHNSKLTTIEPHAFGFFGDKLLSLDLSCNGFNILQEKMFTWLTFCLELDLHADHCTPTIEDIGNGNALFYQFY